MFSNTILSTFSTVAKKDNNNVKENPYLEFDFKFESIPETLVPPFNQIFTGHKNGLIKSNPGGLVIVPRYAVHAEKIHRIQPRKDDVWQITFPKTGTTWVSEMLWLIMNDCDFEKAAKIPLLQRAFFPEIECFGLENVSANGVSKSIYDSIDIDSMPSPRIIKPHLPLNLLHSEILNTSKVVYVARNPKDVIVSFYFHHKLMKDLGCEASIEEFAQYFMDDKVIYAPFFTHVLDAWNQRHHPNMHFVFYEDLKRDLGGELEKMVNFLGKKLSEDQFKDLKEHLKFENVQKNDAMNFEDVRKMGMMNKEGRFMRKGKVGDWKNYFSPELNKKIDQWIETNLAGTDLRFVTELEEQD